MDFKRTSEFQALLTHIGRQLTPLGFTVAAPKRLPHTLDGEREVDIVVEGRVERELVIGVECALDDEPTQVGWVEQRIGKHYGLPTDKLVLVSQSGFSYGAVRCAWGSNVEALTVEAACGWDWQRVVSSI